MHKLALAALGLTLAACAVGSTATDGEPDDSGVGGDDGSAHTDGARGDAASGSDTGSPGDDGGTTDAGTDSGGTDSGSDSGTTIACDSPNACSAGTQLGTISGDTSSNDVTANGATSQWFTLNVTENDSSVLAVPMKLAVALNSPPGANFDLYVYEGAGIGSIECNAVAKSSTNGTGQSDNVSLTWGETGSFANGTDDGKTITIEVRAVTMPCDPNATWSLTAHGH